MARYKAPYRLVPPTKRGGNYYYRLGNDPKRTKHTTGCQTEKEARAYCQKIIDEATKLKSEVYFSDYAKDFFNPERSLFLQNMANEGRPVSNKLIADYHGYVKNYLLPYFGNFLLTDITSFLIKKWRTELKSGTISLSHLDHPPANATINHVKRILTVILQQAYEEGIVPTNAGKDVRPMSKNQMKTRDSLTEKEIEQLFPKDNAKLIKIWGTIENASMLYLVMTSGLRSGELRALRWENIDFQNYGVRVLHAIKATNEEGLPKSRKARGSIVPKRTIQLLKKWKSISKPISLHSFIYPGRDGSSSSCAERLRYALRKALDNAGIELNGRNIVVHSLRHTYDTKMGCYVPGDVLRKTIGHNSVEMTDHYDHLDPNEAIRIFHTKYASSIEDCWK